MRRVQPVDMAVRVPVGPPGRVQPPDRAVGASKTEVLGEPPVVRLPRARSCTRARSSGWTRHDPGWCSRPVGRAAAGHRHRRADAAQLAVGTRPPPRRRGRDHRVGPALGALAAPHRHHPGPRRRRALAGCVGGPGRGRAGRRPARRGRTRSARRIRSVRSWSAARSDRSRRNPDTATPPAVALTTVVGTSPQSMIDGSRATHRHVRDNALYHVLFPAPSR